MQSAQPAPLPAFAGSLLPLLAPLDPALPCSFHPRSAPPALRPIVRLFSGPQSVYQETLLLVGNPGAQVLSRALPPAQWPHMGQAGDKAGTPEDAVTEEKVNLLCEMA